jgi:hypothetical protein
MTFFTLHRRARLLYREKAGQEKDQAGAAPAKTGTRKTDTAPPPLKYQYALGAAGEADKARKKRALTARLRIIRLKDGGD